MNEEVRSKYVLNLMKIKTPHIQEKHEEKHMKHLIVKLLKTNNKENT